MKIKSLAQFLVFALLMASLTRPAFAEGPQPDQHSTAPDDTSSPCGSVEAVTPGDTVTDDVSDVSAAYIDITEVSSSLSGETLTALLHLRDVPETLTFNRTGISENRKEYSWGVAVDVDNNPENGDGGFDYLLSAYHIVRLSDKGANSEVPIGDQAEASIWRMDPGSITRLKDASLEVSAAQNTITLTGTIPGITSESRLSFRTYDYGRNFGSDTVECPSPLREGHATVPCSSVESAAPGNTVFDDVSEDLAAHIDITEVSTSLSGETLTVVFHLREVPETLTFDRTGVPENALEYSWEVAIDVDGTGRHDYTLAARHYVYPDDSGTDRAASIAANGTVQVNTWERHLKGGKLLADASMEISTQDRTITLSGDIPGITTESRLAFETFDYLHGSDVVGCPTPLRQAISSSACDTDGSAVIVPGQTVTAGVSDGLASHVDITEVSTALAGETLAAIFHLRDLPESLVFDREGVSENFIEYYWQVLIDSDRNPETGIDGFEYTLSASYAVSSDSEGRNAAASIGSKVQTLVLKAFGSGGYVVGGAASIVVSAGANTITLVGDIPGITPDARLEFGAYDFHEDIDQVACQPSSIAGDTE